MTLVDRTGADPAVRRRAACSRPCATTPRTGSCSWPTSPAASSTDPGPWERSTRSTPAFSSGARYHTALTVSGGRAYCHSRLTARSMVKGVEQVCHVGGEVLLGGRLVGSRRARAGTRRRYGSRAGERRQPARGTASARRARQHHDHAQDTFSLLRAGQRVRLRGCGRDSRRHARRRWPELELCATG